MKKDTKIAVERWVTGAGPASAHPCDKERYYNIIYQCLVNNDRLDSEELAKILKTNLNWAEEKIEDFSSKKSILAEYIIGFIDYLKSEKEINIYNEL
jgi:hypothetical protein